MLSYFLISRFYIPRGYEKFQTFDEYSLKGVKVGKLKLPFVAVKAEKDTIKVLIVRGIGGSQKLVEYVNMNDYWFNFDKYQLKYDPKCQCDTTPYYLETYIFNDTIMTYGYYLKNGNSKFLERINLKTKNIELSLDNEEFIFSKTNHFDELRYIVQNYKDNFENYDYGVSQKNTYSVYEKKIVGDILILYENIGNSMYKKGDVYNQTQLGKLGEYEYRLNYNP